MTQILKANLLFLVFSHLANTIKHKNNNLNLKPLSINFHKPHQLLEISND